MNATPSYLGPEDFNELDAILDDLRIRDDETPQWEFCEGFMAALVCCRRRIPVDKALSVLLGIEFAHDAVLAKDPAAVQDTVHYTAHDATQENALASFSSEAQRAQFLNLWSRRIAEVTAALDTEVQTLEDERCYTPELVDLRSALANLPDHLANHSPNRLPNDSPGNLLDDLPNGQANGVAEADSANFNLEDLPSFAQVWALGFMFAVEAWPEEWVSPKDKDAAAWFNASLEAMVAMTEPDTGPAEISPLEGEDGTPTTSIARLNAFGDAIWAAYDLREMWKTIGPRVITVRKAATPGRNDLCDCGSGKKYKKCHGAN